MKNFKKILCLVLALLMVFSLAACGQSKAGIPGWSMRTEKMYEEEALAPLSDDQKITIKTEMGDLTGIQKNGYRAYYGIPFATAERFEKPVLSEKWEGTLDATKIGQRANQYFGFFGVADSTVTQYYFDDSTFLWDDLQEDSYGEDCLNLNVWTPDNAKNCPVLIYIHGGSCVTGSNSDMSTDGEAYAARGIVTVSINYRLNCFGQVYEEGTCDGNLYLEDQAAAIQWVKKHIKEFGGDPKRIVISGESAGAACVQDLLISGLLKDGDITGAIMMSGGGDLSRNSNPADSASVEGRWKTIESKFGVSNLEGLKDVDARELYSAWLETGSAAKPILNHTNLTKNVPDSIADNTILNVPVIIGQLSHDMYPMMLYSSAVEYAKSRSEVKGAKPVYLYYFDRPKDPQFGAYHGMDLYYFFGTLYRNVKEMDEIDYRISNNMVDYVSNFVKTGDPNGKDYLGSELAKWTPATSESPMFMEFGENEAGMFYPDEDKVLSISMTNNSSPFPFKNYLDTTRGEAIQKRNKPVSDNNGTKAATYESIIGDWEIIGWNVMGSGQFQGLNPHQLYSFSEDELVYDAKDGNVYNTSWEFVDGKVDLKGWGTAWPASMQGSNLLLEDPRYGIQYVCEPIGGQIVEPEKPIEERIVGNWRIEGWYVDASGQFSGLDVKAYYDFTDDGKMVYDDGKGAKYNTGWAIVEDNKVQLLGWGTTWPVDFDEDGKLLLGDVRYGITYRCVLE